ncbi:Zn-ribbon domain-containing OB-fold protein [Nocardioides psychrotolerans]|uniref:DNA-binding protein n=1 Tax=Nocardioides psychrotolerans TaxID=1005945 RepID=A0A1I3INQ0_9ACTN|nr:OB-fold domain-containing protein [Nocardioides psychrotolerans]SFI49604.1 hypothetical protein SAMN05216561_10993 [Nocardioides psychrotolerans]
MSEMPEPGITPVNQPFWTALERGELTFQRCGSCGGAWLPAREECPRCLAAEPGWEVASGRGRIISWVVYHHAAHPGFADRLPYNVAVVELDEGPRLITNILADEGDLGIELPVVVRIEREATFSLPRFSLA